MTQTNAQDRNIEVIRSQQFESKADILLHQRFFNGSEK